MKRQQDRGKLRRHSGYWALVALAVSLTVDHEFAGAAECGSAVQDQVQADFGGWVDLRSGGDAQHVYAQTFTPEITGYLCTVMVSGCWADVYPERPTTFTIVDTIAGLPGTNVLGRAALTHLSCDAQLVYYGDTPVFLRAGETYAMILETDAPHASARCYSFRASQSQAYTRGALWERTAGGWVAAGLGDGDIVFATYMLAYDPAIRLATPVEGAQLREGEAVLLTGELRPDILGSATVAFYLNEQLLGTDDTAPFSMLWQTTSPGAYDLTAVVSTSGLTATSAVVRVVVNAVGPANDDFAQRTLIESTYSVQNFSNAGATLEPLEPQPVAASAGKTVWWKWQAQRTSPVTLQVGAEPQTNALVAIYTGGYFENLVLVTNRAGGCSFFAEATNTYVFAVDSLTTDLVDAQLWLAQSDLEISLPAAGEVLRAPAMFAVKTTRTEALRTLSQVAVYASTNLLASQTNAPFEFNITLSEPGPHELWLEAADTNGVVTASQGVPVVVRPQNDDFENAIVLSGYWANGTNSNRAGTLQRTRQYPWDPWVGELTYGDNQGGHSIWYRWTAPADGICTISATGAGFGVLINACVGPTVSSLSSVGNNALAAGPIPVSLPVAQGVVYHFSLDGFFGEEGPVAWSLSLRPENDDFANRTWFNGTRYERVLTAGGASLEPGESSLAGSSAVGSLWYSWTAPISAATTVSISSSTVPTRVAVFTGSSIAGLQVVADSGIGFVLNPSAGFHAAEGTQYQIGVFFPEAATSEVRFLLSQTVPRMIVPSDGAIFPAPAQMSLEAQFGDGTGGGEVRFYVNDALLGTVSAPPYKLPWNNIGAGTYKLRAERVANGVTSSTLPVCILVYAGEAVPAPRIFAGPFGQYSYAINAVGLLSVLGSPASQFGIAGGTMGYYPRAGMGAAGVRRWKWISAGSSDIFWNVPYSGGAFFSWGLTEDGELFRNGTELIAPPAGVSRWVDVLAGSGTCFAIGDDGRVYLGGVTPITATAQGVPWKRVAVSQYRFATLSSGGAGYTHWVGASGDPVSTLLPFPAGITEWLDVQATAHEFWFCSNDRQLYRVTGDGQMSRLTRPAGVQRWIKYVAGGLHVLGIGDNGQLYAWGRNWEGQLGTGGQPTEAAVPTKVALPPGVTAWSDIAAGYMHSLAIGNDCSLYSWGANGAGQLGIGPVPNQPWPVRVANVGVLCGTPVIYTEGTTDRLEDGSLRLHFSSDLNRSYYIQYTDDLAEWRTALPVVIGTGGVMEWIDNGPPKTEAHPATVNSRYYRVVFAP